MYKRQTLNAELSDAVIFDFLLHWEIADLVKIIGQGKVLWTDPANWMGRVVFAGPNFRYRYVPGDITELIEAQDAQYLKEFLGPAHFK